MLISIPHTEYIGYSRVTLLVKDSAVSIHCCSLTIFPLPLASACTGRLVGFSVTTTGSFQFEPCSAD